MYAIRGAITIYLDNPQEIHDATIELIDKIIKFNKLDIDNIISIVFSCTRDIKSSYPAEAARSIGINNAALLCLQEMYVENSMEKCIRVLIHVHGEKKQREVRHIFLRDAVKLRPDLVEGKN